MRRGLGMFQIARAHPWTAAVAAAVAAGIAALGVANWTADSSENVHNSTQPVSPIERKDGAVTDVPAMGPYSAEAKKATPNGRAGPEASADPSVWRSERVAFLSDNGFAAAIQQALSNPTAARLFYARMAIDRCSNLRALAVVGHDGAAARTDPALAGLAQTCDQVLALNGNQVEFFAKLRAARVGTTDQSILDALDGRASAQGSTIAQRFAAVAPTDDPLLLAEIGYAWLRSPRPSLAGTPVGDDAAAIYHEAWALAACEATSSCDSSVGALRLCAVRQLCDGSLRSRLQSVFSKEDYALLVAHADQVASALRSKDFSAFH